VARPSELALVDRARAALVARRWQAALAAAAEHAALYPAGILAEEREAIAIEALARSGRRADAGARLDDLVRRAPRSSYRRHLERLVDR
jgi:hypothetical protein